MACDFTVALHFSKQRWSKFYMCNDLNWEFADIFYKDVDSKFFRVADQQNQIV